MLEPTERAVEFLKRYEKLKASRSIWNTHFQELADITWPDAADFITTHEKGERRGFEIYDDTPKNAAEKFSAVFQALLTPNMQRWHTILAEDPDLNRDAGVREWMDSLTDTLFRLRRNSQSGYYTSKNETYKSLGVFGTGVELTESDGNGGIRYRHIPLANVYVATNQFGKVDTVYYCYKLPARAAKQKWGDKIPERVEKALKEDPWQEFDFLHLVTPREDFDRERRDAKGRPWMSLEIAVDDKLEMAEDGYFELPYQVARYTVTPGEMYGRSPAMLVRSTNQTLQKMMRTFLISGEKVADPPLLGTDDGVTSSYGNRPDLRPGFMNYGAVTPDGKPLLMPLHTGARLDLTHEMMEVMRGQIREAFFTDLHQLLKDHPGVTATEIIHRAEAEGKILTPVVGRIQEELLDPQIEREVALVQRMGLIPPVPEALQEALGYRIEYQSEASQMQQLGMFKGYQRVIELLAPHLQINPSLLDQLINPIELGEAAMDIVALPQRIRVSAEERQQIQQAQQEAANEATALEQGAQGAQGLKTAAEAMKTLREVPLAG